MFLRKHDKQMRKYTLLIALVSILVATRIQAAGDGPMNLFPAGKSMFMTGVYAVLISLLLAGGVYGLVYWMKKRNKGQR